MESGALKPFALNSKILCELFLSALQSLKGSFARSAKSKSGGDVTTDFSLDLSGGRSPSRLTSSSPKDAARACQRISHTKTGTDQDLVEVLAVVSLRLLSEFVRNTGRDALLLQEVLGLVVDRTLNCASAHSDTSRRCACGSGEQARDDGGGHRAEALRHKINRGDLECIDGGENLIVDALVLGVFHDTSNLSRVLLGLR